MRPVERKTEHSFQEFLEIENLRADTYLTPPPTPLPSPHHVVQSHPLIIYNNNNIKTAESITSRATSLYI